MYKEQLAREGLPIETVNVNDVPKTTVSVYPDASKDLKKLDLSIPVLIGGYKRNPKLEDITLDEVRNAFSKFKPRHWKKRPIGRLTTKEDSALPQKENAFLDGQARKLKKLLLYNVPLSPIGLLSFCLDYAKNYNYDIGGVFEAIKKEFSGFNQTDIYEVVNEINAFRNTYIAHVEKELTNVEKAPKGLISWVVGLYRIYSAHV